MSAYSSDWGKVHRVDQLREAMEMRDAKKNASINNKPDNDRKYHSTVVVGRLGEIENKLDAFYASMEREYPNFEVISVNMNSNWQNVQAYVTYRI